MAGKIGPATKSCLLGEKMSCDWGPPLDDFVAGALGRCIRYINWLLVCQEIEYGPWVQGEITRLVGDSESPRIMTVSAGGSSWKPW